LLTGAATVFTFNGTNIGAADATRRLVFCLDYGDSTAFRTLTGFTVDAVSILPSGLHASVNGGGPNAGTKHILSKLHPTGTTANIVVTINSAAASIDCNLDVFSALNEVNATPHNTMSDASIASGVLTGNIAIPAGGWCVATAAAFGSPVPTNFNWTNLGEAIDDVRGNTAIRVGSAFASGMSANAALAVTATATPTPTTGPIGGLLAMSWV
jgi:hypothetical protein